MQTILIFVGIYFFLKILNLLSSNSKKEKPIPKHKPNNYHSRQEHKNYKYIEPGSKLYTVRDSQRPDWENYAIECNAYVERQEEMENYTKQL